MIVKMKKLTLLCTHFSKEKTLAALRTLGVVHLQPVQPPEGADLDEARGLNEHLKRALEMLPKHSSVSPTGKNPHETVKVVWELIHRKQALVEQVEALTLDLEHYEPFGDFSPETVRGLNAEGVTVKLYKVPIKESPAIAEGAQWVELSRDRNAVYGALIGRGDFSVEAEEVRLPGQSLNAMQSQLAELRSAVEQTDAEFHQYAGDRHAVATLKDEAQDRVHYLEARAGMGAEESVSYLCGFFPAEREAELRAEAESNGWAVLVEEPASEDHVPTLFFAIPSG